MDDLKKEFDFGKIDFWGSGRKINRVTVDVWLKYKTINGIEYPVFCAGAKIWNLRETRCICGGQCLDEIKNFLKNKTFDTIYRLWKTYHLNNYNAGTIEQTKIIKDYFAANNIRYDYDTAVSVLKDCDMYKVRVGNSIIQSKTEDDMYEYGHGWVYFPIPEDDLEIIKQLLSE